MNRRGFFKRCAAGALLTVATIYAPRLLVSQKTVRFMFEGEAVSPALELAGQPPQWCLSETVKVDGAMVYHDGIPVQHHARHREVTLHLGDTIMFDL